METEAKKWAYQAWQRWAICGPRDLAPLLTDFIQHLVAKGMIVVATEWDR